MSALRRCRAFCRHVFDREMILGKFGYQLGARTPVTATTALVDSLGREVTQAGFVVFRILLLRRSLQIDLDGLGDLVVARIPEAVGERRTKRNPRFLDLA